MTPSRPGFSRLVWAGVETFSGQDTSTGEPIVSMRYTAAETFATTQLPEGKFLALSGDNSEQFIEWPSNLTGVYGPGGSPWRFGHHSQTEKNLTAYADSSFKDVAVVQAQIRYELLKCGTYRVDRYDNPENTQEGSSHYTSCDVTWELCNGMETGYSCYDDPDTGDCPAQSIDQSEGEEPDTPCGEIGCTNGSPNYDENCTSYIYDSNGCEDQPYSGGVSITSSYSLGQAEVTGYYWREIDAGSCTSFPTISAEYGASRSVILDDDICETARLIDLADVPAEVSRMAIPRGDSWVAGEQILSLVHRWDPETCTMVRAIPTPNLDTYTPWTDQLEPVNTETFVLDTNSGLFGRAPETEFGLRANKPVLPICTYQNTDIFKFVSWYHDMYGKRVCEGVSSSAAANASYSAEVLYSNSVVIQGSGLECSSVDFCGNTPPTYMNRSQFIVASYNGGTASRAFSFYDNSIIDADEFFSSTEVSAPYSRTWTTNSNPTTRAKGMYWTHGTTYSVASEAGTSIAEGFSVDDETYCLAGGVVDVTDEGGCACATSPGGNGAYCICVSQPGAYTKSSFVGFTNIREDPDDDRYTLADLDLSAVDLSGYPASSGLILEITSEETASYHAYDPEKYFPPALGEGFKISDSITSNPALPPAMALVWDGKLSSYYMNGAYDYVSGPRYSLRTQQSLEAGYTLTMALPSQAAASRYTQIVELEADAYQHLGAPQRGLQRITIRTAAWTSRPPDDSGVCVYYDEFDYQSSTCYFDSDCEGSPCSEPPEERDPIPINYQTPYTIDLTFRFRRRVTQEG